MPMARNTTTSQCTTGSSRQVDRQRSPQTRGCDLYERSLFVTAACFNWAVGVLVLGGYPLAANLLQLAGPATVWVHLVAATVVIFGVAYWLVAKQPQRYRPFVGLGAAGKLTFAAIIYYHWFA